MTSEAAPTKSDVKQQIRQIKRLVVEALSAGKRAEAKKLRRRKRQLKAVTWRLAKVAPKPEADGATTAA